MTAIRTCRICGEYADHYVGGKQWLCSRHFLGLFGRCP